jgi:hypothetical protein
VSRIKSRAAVVTTAVVAVTGVATAAVAYYALTSTTSNGTATARTLASATAPSATVVSSTQVNLAWTLPSSQVPGAIYAVTNTVDGHVACTVTTASCSDTAALPGVANTYSLRATLSGSTWVSPATTFSSAATPDVLTLTTAAGGTIGTQTAGTAFGIKVTAQKWSNGSLVTDTAYTGSGGSAKTFAWSGLPTSPDGTAPAYPATSVSFSSGVSTTALNVTAYDAGANTLTATEGARTGSASFTVNAAGAALRFNGTSSACGSTTAITTLTGKISRDLDDYGNTATFSGAPTVALGPTNKGSFNPTSVSFANNGAKDTGTFTYTASGSGNVTLTATATGYVTGTCAVKQ